MNMVYYARRNPTRKIHRRTPYLTQIPTLDRLESVNLREYWAREDTSFTPWLSADENIQIPSDALGLRLEVKETEANVGPFRADILCREVGSESYVLIENQIEPTDHTHLGQIITYSAGLGAAKIIWIARRFRDEHRAALDWLNSATTESFGFFGVEVELWRIGNSKPAPRFDVVAKPNNWSKQVVSARISGRSGGWHTQTERYKRLWEAFSEFIANSDAGIPKPNSTSLNWIRLDIGKLPIRLVISYAFPTGRMKIFILLLDVSKMGHNSGLK